MDDIFWERSYKNEAVQTFGSPSIEVKNIANKLYKSIDVLDMGCGEGRHSLYLAKKGFNVDAFDISEGGILKLGKLSSSMNLKINSFVQNVEQYVFEKEYDLIISHGLFQFIAKEVRDKAIKQMKENTKPGGYNIIAVFTDIIELPEDLKPYLVGIFKEKEINTMYEDWIIEEFQTYIFEDEHENNIKHKHAVNKIVARKPI